MVGSEGGTEQAGKRSAIRWTSKNIRDNRTTTPFPDQFLSGVYQGVSHKDAFTGFDLRK